MFSKPNHKDIPTVNSNQKVKPKTINQPNTITKLSTTKQNRFKPNHKVKPKPLPILIVLSLSEKSQVPRRLAERDQLQHNQLCNHRGGTTCAPIEFSHSQIAFYSADDFNFDYLTDYLDEVLCFFTSDIIE